MLSNTSKKEGESSVLMADSRNSYNSMDKGCLNKRLGRNVKINSKVKNCKKKRKMIIKANEYYLISIMIAEL